MARSKPEQAQIVQLVDVRAEDIDVAAQTKQSMSLLIPMAMQVVSNALTDGRGDPTACRMARWVIEVGMAMTPVSDQDEGYRAVDSRYSRTLSLVK